jgi:nicotinate-nucleotide pyrophosphorylase (carboxylating)
MPIDLNELALPELYRELNSTNLVRRLLELAREEDLGERNWDTADVTSVAFVDDWLKGEGKIVVRSGGVVAGLATVDEILTLWRADVDLHVHIPDGQHAEPGATIATLRGNLRAMLMAERTILNMLGRLSGIATRTHRFVQAASSGGGAKVFDTRKTTPGLRILEKYAVRCGGGFLHRLGLHDAVLIKDNHLAVMKSRTGGGDLATLVKKAARLARDEAPRTGLRFVMLEVDAIDQLRAILDGDAAGRADDQVTHILLDNMNAEQIRACVQLRNDRRAPVQLEASGGVTLDTIAAISATGVDRISTGSLTHSATWLDVGLDV